VANNISIHVEPIKAQGHPDKMIASLMSLIERGVLKEGDILPPERDLAKQFKVGRNALREAIKVLEVYGLVERKTKVGTIIRRTTMDSVIKFAFAGLPASPKVFDEIQSFRLVLETGIADAVIERIDPPTIVRLAGLIERMGATDDIREQALCDYDFHATLVAVSGNSIIIRVFEVLSEPIKRLMELGKGKSGASFAQELHRKLVAALERRDAAVYAATMREHLNAGRRFLDPGRD
jgi:GntR family transcriptional regulator, transcriptional repressor for pyruvate dehydrogenase complex